MLRDLTDAFHLKESSKSATGEFQNVPLGEGNVQSHRILADALARGWVGPLSLEPHLSHSAAVMVTGPTGQQNQKLSDLGPVETFQVAAAAAKTVLGNIKAPVV